MKRFRSLQDCHDFGLDSTYKRSAGGKVHTESSCSPRRTVYLREVIPWLRSYDVNYGLLTNNCHDFARYLMNEFDDV